jgi:hypothetical protein
MAGKEPAEAEPPVSAVASAANPGDQQLFGQFVGQKEEVVLPKPRPIKHASLGGKASKPKKRIAMAHGYKERTPRTHLGADTRWASNELPPYRSFLEPIPGANNDEQLWTGFSEASFMAEMPTNAGPQR